MEFIPAYEVIKADKKRNEQSEYEHFIALCAKNGMVPTGEGLLDIAALLCLDEEGSARTEGILDGYRGKVQLFERMQRGEKIFQ